MPFLTHAYALFFAALLAALALTRGDGRRWLTLAAGNLVFLALFVPPQAAAWLLGLTAFAWCALRLPVAVGVSGLLGGLFLGRAWGVAAGAPVSFSFAVFPLLSLVLDVRGGRAKAPRALELAAVSPFFPVLASGPVFRPAAALAEGNGPDPARARVFVERVTLGLLKKFVVADRLGVLYQQLGERAADAPAIYLLMFYVYAAQVYFDFAGYSDLAIGFARALGVRLPENFRAPYLAESPVDWWRRWHVSLAEFLRDYVYYPLFFRVKNIYLCTYATFLLNGLWHGFGWNYAFLGLYWGTAISLYLLVRPWWDARLPRPLRIFLTLQIGVGSFVFFLPEGWRMLTEGLSGSWPGWASLAGAWSPSEAAVVIAAALAALLWRRVCPRHAGARHFLAVGACWLAIFTLGLFWTEAGFIYSQF